MKKQQQGFSAIECIIILLILLILILGGWYVWKKSASDSGSKDAKAKTTSSSTAGEKKAAADPTSDWVVYANEAGDYAFKHPGTWVFAGSPEDCTAGTALFAPAAASLGKCATESGGQMQASSTMGDVRGEYQFAEAYYTGATDEAVTVEGVAGNKLTATVVGMDDGMAIGGWPDNTKIVRYLFFTAGRTYVISYVQQPDYPDVLSDFNLLVTSTFRFASDAYGS